MYGDYKIPGLFQPVQIIDAVFHLTWDGTKASARQVLSSSFE